MEILSDSEDHLKWAAAALSSGLLVAFPTETVYGLGGNAFDKTALAKIFEAKNRPHFDPLIVHIASMESLPRIADLTALSAGARQRLEVLTEKLWPGPLTLILPKTAEIPGLATSGLETVAVRFPSHPVAQKLIQLSTGAIAAPSANPFGFLSPTRAEHVKSQLGGKIDFIVDGGRTEIGLESTVLDITGKIPVILRHGGTSREAIQALTGQLEVSSATSSESPTSPGQLESHYAPGTPLYLYEAGKLDGFPLAADEGRLYFSPGKNTGLNPETTRILSETSNLTEAAANFFDMLHDLDNLGLKIIRAEMAPAFGLGEAINDRLRKAQGKR